MLVGSICSALQPARHGCRTHPVRIHCSAGLGQEREAHIDIKNKYNQVAHIGPGRLASSGTISGVRLGVRARALSSQLTIHGRSVNVERRRPCSSVINTPRSVENENATRPAIINTRRRCRVCHFTCVRVTHRARASFLFLE